MTRALVDTAWVARHIGDPSVKVIEINRDGIDAYVSGHIPGAIGWNWKDALWDPYERQFPSEQAFAKRLGDVGISNESTVVLYGVPVQFGSYAWWVFKYLGHKDVRLLDGGAVRWEREGRPLTKTVPEAKPARYLPNTRNDRMRAGRADILHELQVETTTFLDHRSHEEYSGSRVSPPGMADVGAERYGRIPGAFHVPYDSLLNEDDTFKTPTELRDLVAHVLKDKDQRAISYCRLSHRATLAYFALTEILDFRNVRVYDGSWTEWGSMVGVPIER